MASILRLIEILWQFQTKLANRRTATAKFAQRFYTVWADSTQWGTRRIAAIEKFVVSANVGFLAQGHTHPIGHQPPVAVTSKFLMPSGVEWLVFGDQVDRENFRTRPVPAVGCLRRPAV